MKEEYFQAIYQLITTGHWITDQISKELKEFGVTEPQYNVLRIIRGSKGKPISVGEILSNMVQRNSNITRIVDKLVAKNYATRHECPTNRRKMDIIITDEGETILKKLDKKVQAFHKPYFDNLSTEELISLKELIKKLKTI